MEPAWTERLRAIEVASTKGAAMAHLPGRIADHRASMLGHATLLLYRFESRWPFDGGRFVAWASAKVRDQLYREAGYYDAGKGHYPRWVRRAVRLDGAL